MDEYRVAYRVYDRWYGNIYNILGQFWEEVRNCPGFFFAVLSIFL
jgi:hypothetical protein